MKGKTRIELKSHVETGKEIGYKRGIDVAISLLNKKKQEILKHRSHCRKWTRLGTTQDSNRIFCTDCHVGSISKIIEPLIVHLKNIKNYTKSSEKVVMVIE